MLLIFLFMAQPSLVGLLFIESSRSHSDAPHSVGLLWISDQPEAYNYLTTHNNIKRQTSMPPAVFEPTIIIIIIFIYCNWAVTRWQWLFYMYTKYEIV